MNRYTGCLREEYTLLLDRFIGFLWIKYGHEELYIIQNFVSFQNMPIFWSSDHHRMRQSSVIKIRRIFLWRTQNPTITRYKYEFEVIVHNVEVCTAHAHNLHQKSFHYHQSCTETITQCLNSLVLKWNQVYEKTASKRPQQTKCNFSMIFKWKWTNMRHLRPYWPQIASELQDEFWVRQSKIRRFLIRLLLCILWYSELQKMGIFWKLTKFWMI